MSKPRPKKRTTGPARKKGGKPVIRRDLILPVLAAVALVAAAAVFLLSSHGRKPEHKPAEPPTVVQKAPSPAKPKPDYPPVKEPSPPASKPAAPATIPDGRPRVAIVIDDMGSDPAHLDAILALDVPISIAILPYQPYSASTARKAEAAGLDVLLHLPMQADAKYTGLGEGALFTDMDSKEIADKLGRDLGEVPGAIGVNNHMGSAFTSDRAAMTFVLKNLKSRGLFFLDSRTTAETVAESTAREMGVPTAARKVFLDDSNEIDDVRKQFGRLIELAKKDGEAIAIGHPRPATLQVLSEELPRLAASDIKLVRVSSLVR